MDISIIVCTYNRASRLKACLDSIANLDLDIESRDGKDLEIEVLVVDNASTDNTAEVVTPIKAIRNLRYLYEAKQGKSYALNLALKEAAGRVLVFTDDDITLAPNVVNAFWSAYQTHGTQYAWFGGQVTLDWHTTKKPNWLNDDIHSVLDGVLGVHDLGQSNRPYGVDDKYPIGALLMVTRALAMEVGEFRTDLGPSGVTRGASDDTDYIMRAQSEDMQGYYVANARARHYVDPHRLTLKGFFAYGHAKGVNARRANPNEHSSFSWQRVLSQLIRGCWQLIKGRSGNLRVCLLNIGFEFGKRRD